ncbi:MAG TPA: hypothetical protein VGL60_13355 [Acidimicrobiales bacterium]
MSTTMGGPGWWLASDGRWYPPETHPDYQDPAQSWPTGAAQQSWAPEPEQQTWAPAEPAHESWPAEPDHQSWPAEPVIQARAPEPAHQFWSSEPAQPTWSAAEPAHQVAQQTWSPEPAQPSWSGDEPAPARSAEDPWQAATFPQAHGASTGSTGAPAAPAGAPLEMSAPGPIPPAFSLSGAPPATGDAALTIEQARYLGGFLPEPEGHDSSFVRCSAAGIQFRTRRGVAWVPWHDISSVVAEGPAEVAHRFSANARLAAGAYGLPPLRADAAYLAIVAGQSEMVFEVIGMSVLDLAEAIRPLLDRIEPTGTAGGNEPIHLNGRGKGNPSEASSVTRGRHLSEPAAGAAPGGAPGPEAGAPRGAAQPHGAAVEAVEQFMHDVAAQGLLDDLHGPSDAETLRAAGDALDAAHAATSAAQHAAHAAEQAADAVHRLTVVRTTEAEIGDLLIRCQQFIEGAIADAERHAREIVASARSEADVILADATRRAHELEAGPAAYNPSVGLPPVVGPPPAISPESARELNSTIDGYIRVNSELMHELRMLSGTLGVDVTPDAPPAPSSQASSYHSS